MKTFLIHQTSTGPKAIRIADGAVTSRIPIIRSGTRPTAEECADVIIALGTNDIYFGQSLAQIQADMTALVGELQARGLRVHLATPPPMTNGTNTAVLSTEGVRIAFADWERTLPLGVATCFNTTTKKLNFYNGTAWEAVTSA